MRFFDIKVVNQALDLYFKNYSHSDLAKQSVLLAVITSVFLIVLKLVAWIITNSISMQASLNDSCLDALSSFVAYHALRYSSIKFDFDHNYGHEKAEGVFAIFQCLLVMYSGYIICHEAYEFFFTPEPVTNTTIGIIVMIISCFAVYQLLYFQNYVAKKTESLVVKGDSLHYISDFFMNICVMISIFLSKYFTYVDVVCGITVGGYVFYNAFLILRAALHDLMDESMPEETRNKIEQTIIKVKDVKNIKMLRTRTAGMKKYVEARIVVNKDLSIAQANKIASEVEIVITKMFDNVDVIIKPEL
ncbi:MAG: cation transporter [Alphaproteobacteria bacterium]|nr:cation transporter [Alphaproteobacteria bacterium]